MEKIASRDAALSARLGLAGVVALIAGPLASHVELVPPMWGFGLFALGALFGLIALILGVVALIRSRGSQPDAWRGCGLGGIAVGLLAIVAVPTADLPPINDITTDPEDPPAFAAASEPDTDPGRDFGYPGAEFAVQQRRAYPDLAPIPSPLSPSDALGRIQTIAVRFGWRDIRIDPEQQTLEAEDVTTLFRFVDDVVVRVRPAENGSVIDVRSKSRDGKGDLGANAERIRRFRDALTSASSLPDRVGR